MGNEQSEFMRPHQPGESRPASERLHQEAIDLAWRDKACLAGVAVLLFLPLGRNKLLTVAEAEILGGAAKLEALTVAELERLGLQRYTLPKLELCRNGSVMEATVCGDTAAYFRARLERPGFVELTHLHRGNLPGGAGAEFLQQALKAHNALPTKQLILSGIENEPTIDAWTRGIPAQKTVLGECATEALKSLGIKPKSYEYVFVQHLRQLNISIQTGR